MAAPRIDWLTPPQSKATRDMCIALGGAGITAAFVAVGGLCDTTGKVTDPKVLPVVSCCPSVRRFSVPYHYDREAAS